jgi:hypothetical protein
MNRKRHAHRRRWWRKLYAQTLLAFYAIAAFVLVVTPALAEPLQDPYRDCSQQTLETAIAFERAGDRDGLRDHVRSYGCRLIFPREAFELFPSERERSRDRRGVDGDELR